MSDAVAVCGPGPAGEFTKPDFLTLLTGTAAAVGTVASAWPRIGSMNPAQDVPPARRLNPPPDSARMQPNHAQWLVPGSIFTHLDCVPPGHRPADPRGERGGWFRPCHGSQYETFGRVRQGLVPANPAVPDHAFDADSKIKIG